MADETLAGSCEQKRANLVFKHRRHFAGRSWQQNGDGSGLSVLDCNAWRGTVVVLEDFSAFRHHSLFFLVFRQSTCRFAEQLFDSMKAFRVKDERQTEGLCYRLLCQIIAGRAETACHHNQIRAGKRVPEGARQAVSIVTDHSLMIQRDPQFSQTPGEVRSVGIDDFSQQKFRAHTQDLRCLKFLFILFHQIDRPFLIFRKVHAFYIL